MRNILGAVAALAICAAPVAADEIEDVLQGALEAYQAGDAKTALEDVAYVQELLKEVAGQDMEKFLPAPLEGWTRELTQGDAGMAMFGGGTAINASYTSDAGSFDVTLLMDSPIIGTFAAMFGSAATMGAMGELVRVDREKFVLADREIQGLVDKRIYVKFEGQPMDAMRAHLETMDIRGLKDF